MRKFIRRHLPHPDTLCKQKVFALLGNSLLHPRLWHLNRHSAALGVAIGLFCSLIPGPLQMPGAAILCIVLRANLPLALLGTLFSNPLTIVPLYMAAFMIGRFVTRSEAHFVLPPEPDWQALGATLDAWTHWLFALGHPLLIGLPLLALLLAGLSYFGVKGLWEIHLRHAWKVRKKNRTPL
ncbi:MAG: hypothetical protein H6R19_387 [Proteobacteria bacterium]|nr:hypothetical protein [Pseudomonadota bacterium]